MSVRSRSDLRSRSPYRTSSAWSPAALAPYAWYDVALGGSSSRITDSSGNGRAAVTFAPATAAPAYTAGASFVTFDGVNDYATLPDAAVPGVTPYEFVAVVEFVTIALNERIFDNNNVGTAGGQLYAVSATALRNWVQAGGANKETPSVTIAAGTRYVVRAYRDSTNVGLQVNGGTAVVTATSPVGDSHGGTGYRIATNRFTNADFANLKLHALFTFDRTLSAAETSLLMTYYGV
jgi:hypothetical protein